MCKEGHKHVVFDPLILYPWFCSRKRNQLKAYTPSSSFMFSVRCMQFILLEIVKISPLGKWSNKLCYCHLVDYSSVLAWRIPGMGEPGGLPSTGSHRVGHDWSDLAAAVAAERLSNSQTSRGQLKGSWHCNSFPIYIVLLQTLSFWRK